MAHSQSDAAGNELGIGLLGADSRGMVAVSDTGDTEAHCFNFLGCWWVGVAATGAGSARANDVAVSGLGTATAGSVAVSGTGDAHGISSSAFGGQGLLAVSGLGNATASDGLAVTGFGTARSRGCSGDAVSDATYGYAVSVLGNAYGCSSVSVTGEAGSAAP